METLPFYSFGFGLRVCFGNSLFYSLLFSLLLSLLFSLSFLFLFLLTLFLLSLFFFFLSFSSFFLSSFCRPEDSDHDDEGPPLLPPPKVHSTT